MLFTELGLEQGVRQGWLRSSMALEGRMMYKPVEAK